MHESLGTLWFWWEMENWGLSEGTWIWREKKGNIWFQKAEVQIEATPMLLFPAEQLNKLLSTSTSSAEAVRGHSSDAPKPSVRPRLLGMWQRMFSNSGIKAAPAHAASASFLSLTWIQRTLQVLEGFGEGEIAVFSPPHMFPAVSSSWQWYFFCEDPANWNQPSPVPVCLLEWLYLRTRQQLRTSSACSISSVFLDSLPQLYLHKDKICVPRAVWQLSFPSLGFFFNVTWSKVLPFLPCRAECHSASGAEWQHPHTPTLVPFLWRHPVYGHWNSWRDPQGSFLNGSWRLYCSGRIWDFFFLWSRPKLVRNSCSSACKQSILFPLQTFSLMEDHKERESRKYEGKDWYVREGLCTSSSLDFCPRLPQIVQ